MKPQVSTWSMDHFIYLIHSIIDAKVLMLSSSFLAFVYSASSIYRYFDLLVMHVVLRVCKPCPACPTYHFLPYPVPPTNSSLTLSQSPWWGPWPVIMPAVLPLPGPKLALGPSKMVASYFIWPNLSFQCIFNRRKIARLNLSQIVKGSSHWLFG
jgi:hypothetical protein